MLVKSKVLVVATNRAQKLLNSNDILLDLNNYDTSGNEFYDAEDNDGAVVDTLDDSDQDEDYQLVKKEILVTVNHQMMQYLLVMYNL